MADKDSTADQLSARKRKILEKISNLPEADREWMEKKLAERMIEEEKKPRGDKQ